MDLRDTVVVTGTGRAGARPDALVLDLQLEGHGPGVSEALAALTAAVQACERALPEHELRTHGLGVHPRHDHQGRPAGHTAYQSLQVRTAAPAQAGHLVQRLAEAAGASLGINALRPEASDTSASEREARERAVSDARTRAEDYARLTGRELGAVLWVREGGPHPPGPFGAGSEPRLARLSADVAGPAVDPADQEAVAVVEVAWALRPHR